MRPEMTGDTAKGRSISVVRRLLPGNLNFEMAQAAAMPKTTLAGTTIATVSSVSRIAARASGSLTAARKYAPPFAERLREHDHDRQDEEAGEERGAPRP